jgi:ketosteroid isomerase-like protein
MPETDITRRLPPVIAAYVKASNDADSNAFLGVFTDDALVNDIQREFRAGWRSGNGPSAKSSAPT